MGVQKISKKQYPKKSSTLPKWSQIGDPRGGQSSAKFQLFRNFLHPGPEMGPESSRGPKKVAQGVQKVPKGFQKVAKSHEKAIHKAPTRRPNAMRKQQSNQATKQRRNKATKQQSNQATKQPSNKATKQQSHKATQASRYPRHGGGKAEGNWILYKATQGWPGAQPALKTFLKTLFNLAFYFIIKCVCVFSLFFSYPSKVGL